MRRADLRVGLIPFALFTMLEVLSDTGVVLYGMLAVLDGRVDGIVVTVLMTFVTLEVTDTAVVVDEIR